MRSEFAKRKLEGVSQQLQWREVTGAHKCPLFQCEPDANIAMRVAIHNSAGEWEWTVDIWRGVSISGNMTCATKEDAQKAAEAALANWRDSQRLREWLTAFSTMTPDRFKPEYAFDALNGGWVDA